MLHDKRRWAVGDVATAAELAQKLTESTWCLCTGFRFGGYLFLNDSTCEDGAAEFGVVRESDMRQLESITFGWCNAAKAQAYIESAAEGTMEAMFSSIIPRDRILPLEGHRCRSCA